MQKGCPLSKRELEVLAYVAAGFEDEEIAEKLDLSKRTVRNHMTSIRGKLDVRNRIAAVVRALQDRWILFPNEKTV